MHACSNSRNQIATDMTLTDRRHTRGGLRGYMGGVFMIRAAQTRLQVGVAYAVALLPIIDTKTQKTKEPDQH